MPVTPLLSHTEPDQIVAWQQGKPVSVRQFLADAYHLADNLPAPEHILNLCSDRYHFSVGLAASIIRKKTSLLPPSLDPARISQLKQYAPDLFCLCDNGVSAVDLPQFLYLSAPDMSEVCRPIPEADNDLCIAIVFTSGTTGLPQAHRKTWGMLAHSTASEAERLGLYGDRHYALIGTVPSQHMYGLESTIVMAWRSGNSLCHAHPFYPADIAQALALVPAPRVLVSTPVHLRTLSGSGLEIPELDLIISATAPLSGTLAHGLETQFRTVLQEIYGTTETGIIATRRTALSNEWQLLPGIRMQKEGERICTASDYIDPPIAMNDVIELRGSDRFSLHGRTADLINIAGKRNSLTNLNQQLNSIPGVLDGAYFMPEETQPDRVTRLAAFVVAPQLDAQALTSVLRQRMDPVFLPRPLVFVTELPRNATGKLPHSALQSLFDTHVRTRKKNQPVRTVVPLDHPAFPGHFPGMPILPGVALLDWAIQAIAENAAQIPERYTINSVKFLSPACPGDTLTLVHEPSGSGAIRFDIRSGPRKIVAGTVLLNPPPRISLP
ncbi:MAG TPA: AMP-binding protein [Burkholderiales bacterium]|nr:AMP-binding protein [Burkholderiales bacterium]